MLALKVQNFGLFKSLDVDLDQPGVTFISGINNDSTAADSNGSGKSTLIDALTWGLYGTFPGLTDVAEVIHHGTKKASVDINFEDYRIVRSRTKSGGTLKLWQGKQEITKASQKETQEAIDGILGVGYEVWHNTFAFSQQDRARFLDVQDAQRKSILRSIFDFEAVEQGEKRARVEVKHLSGEIQQAELNLTRLQGQKEAEAALIQRCNQEIRTISAEVAELPELPNLEELEKERDEIAGQIEAAKALEQTARQQLETENEKATAYKIKKAEAERIVQDLKARLEKLSGDQCPVCDTPTSSPKLKKLIGKTQEGIETARKRIETQGKALERAIAQRAEAVEKIDEIIETRAKAQRELSGIESELGSLRLAHEQLDRIQSRADALEAEIKQRQAKLKSLDQQIKNALVGKLNLERELKLYQFWVRGFGISGLQNAIFDRLTGQLQYWSNEYLRTLADNTMELWFDTTMELKGGGTKDRFAVHSIIEGYQGPRASGGQHKKMAISIDLALAEMVRTRSRLSVLFLDEVFDSLDTTGKVRVIDLLDQLKDVYGSVYVISHDYVLSEAERHWRVVRSNGAAELLT